MRCVGLHVWRLSLAVTRRRPSTQCQILQDRMLRIGRHTPVQIGVPTPEKPVGGAIQPDGSVNATESRK